MTFIQRERVRLSKGRQTIKRAQRLYCACWFIGCSLSRLKLVETFVTTLKISHWTKKKSASLQIVSLHDSDETRKVCFSHGTKLLCNCVYGFLEPQCVKCRICYFQIANAVINNPSLFSFCLVLRFIFIFRFGR